MKEGKRSIINTKWLEIKNLFDSKTNRSKEYGSNFPIEGELHKLCDEFIDLLAQITMKFGYKCEVEGITMDLWKDRVWVVYENAGLLQPIAWKLEKDEKSFEDLLKEDQEWVLEEDYEEFEDMDSIEVNIDPLEL